MTKLPKVNVKNYNETILVLMSDISLFDFVIPHAQNHLENLEWTAIKDLHRHKKFAVKLIPHESHSIESYENMAEIFTNYRKGVLDMELFFHKKSTNFINNLKNSLDKAKKQMRGKSNAQKKSHKQEYIEKFIEEMDDFEKMYINEYKRIIPIIFPGSDSEF